MVDIINLKKKTSASINVGKAGSQLSIPIEAHLASQASIEKYLYLALADYAYNWNTELAHEYC